MKSKRSLVISIILVVLISALYRAMPNRPWGFAPQWAIAIFSGALFLRDKKMAFILPLISMFISDLIYQVLYKNGLTVIPGFYSGQWLNYLLFTAMAAYGFLFNTKKISIHTAALQLQVSESTLRRLADEGKIPFTKTGNSNFSQT